MPRTPLAAVHAPTDLSGIACVGYIRVSTENQANEDKTSLADQERAIRGAAARRGLEVGAWFRDEGASGATVEKRPQLRALLAAIAAAPRTDGTRGLILVLNDSRWGRFPDPEEATYWRVHTGKLGWDVRFAEGDDVDNVMARGVMRFIGAAQASEHRNQIRANTRRGMKGSADSGYWTRREPFGFRRQVVHPKGRERILEPRHRKADGERVALVPHESEAAIVRRIFEEYAAGSASVRSLARWLRSEYPGARRWSVTMIHGMLSNRVYVGDVASGPHCSDVDGYGKRDAHPGLVTRELFERVQARLTSNAKQTTSPSRAWALSGLVTCASCGKPYVAGGTWGTNEKTRVPFYAERRDRYVADGDGCSGTMGCVYKHVLERAVIRVIDDVVSRPELRERIAAAVDRYLSGSGQSIEDERTHLTRELGRVETSRARLIDAVADGTITKDEATDRLTSLRDRSAALTTRIQRLQSQKRMDATQHTIRSQLIELASDFRSSAQKVSGAELRALVAPWLASAQFDKVKRTLTVAVRTIPAAEPLSLSGWVWPSGQDQQNLVIRTVTVGRRRIA